ncbi:putative transcription factor RfeD [Aspergillus glaucus CBS 516.65]|uniref:RING zinc finger-like domain-containing protein n=1 Tax=Aspergillus glaucus CBS 516.65 TaxID=1160497 RepID=A0A1L9VWA3_ASPGL|nr:hypothetical protein ASPGLDRAFT_43325 [Aspergillus glaucus CBS 516.65]OJJ88190.1 hypothetical protein ASPGLDRAFT_43325 [Aspergillus glaucus CBS 516.65]
MPPRSSLSSFSVTDASNEVVCPLKNNDGSNCRKRCLGEKRFRSMQEHIRRAHPTHYIPKLPATEESFLLMVNQEKAIQVDSPPDEPHPAAATAAVALAQLHHHRLASDWEEDTRSVELPPLRDHFRHEDSLPPFSPPRPRKDFLLPSILSHSPPPRSSTLPPIHRKDRLPRPRKSSITQNARKPKHDRPRRPSLGERKALSAEPQTAAWAQGKRWEDLIEAATSATEADDDRSSEHGPSPTIPPLIANITSAPLDQPIRSSLPPPAFHPPHRSLPPPYTASPLHKSLTPPPQMHRGRDSDLEPFPSIESSLDSASSASGKNFPVSRNLAPSALSDSSPVYNMYPSSMHARQHHRFSNPTPTSLRSREITIYCASCQRPWALDDCYACTECICGVCRDCVGMFLTSPANMFRNITSSPGSGPTNGMFHGPGPGSGPGPTSHPSPGPRGCPRCRTVGGKWKAFQLEFR